jgi:hypothetical protein
MRNLTGASKPNARTAVVAASSNTQAAHSNAMMCCGHHVLATSSNVFTTKAISVRLFEPPAFCPMADADSAAVSHPKTVVPYN